MADAEKKNIARLDFNIKDAINSLDKVDQKLKSIAESSEKYSKTIGNNLGSSISKNNFDKRVTEVKQSYEGLSKYEKNRAADVAAFQQKQEIKTTEMFKRENLKREQSVKSLSDKIADYANTYLIYQGFNALKNGISDVINEMVKLEEEMVQIDRVLNEDALNIDNYRDKLIQVAYDYANSMDNVTDITLRLAQAGFDSQESLELTKKTLLALNTAELDATQATDDMVAVMSQWGLMTGDAKKEAEDYGNIIDKINRTADSFPTTSADILDALKKTSSAFNIAGASIDETIASIVAAEKASQRGGKVIGTALANITQQLKEDKRMETAESLGINFFKDVDKTEFKPIMQIFAELSTKMQELKDAGKESSKEMQTLLSVFTVFRRNIGASLLGEMGEGGTYDEVMKLLQATDTIGYSMKENSKYMATAKAAQEQFNTTLLKFKTEIWDGQVENVFRSMLLFGQDLVNNLSWLIKTFGILPTTIGAATLAFTAFNKQMKMQVTYKNGVGFSIDNSFFDKIKKAKEEVTRFKNIVNGASTTNYKFSESFQNYVNNIGDADVTTKGYIASLLKQKAATVAAELATVALNAAISLGLPAAVTFVISLIDKLVHAEENAVKAAQETLTKLNEQMEEYNKINESAESLIEEYDELKTSYDKLNSIQESLRTVEQNEKLVTLSKEIKDKQEQITTFLKEQRKYTSDLVDDYDGQYKKVKEIYETNLKNLKITQQAAIIAAREARKSENFVNSFGVSTGGPSNTNTALKELGFDESYFNKIDSAATENAKRWQSVLGLTSKEPTALGFLDKLTSTEQIDVLEEMIEKLTEGYNAGKDYGEIITYLSGKLAPLKEAQQKVNDEVAKYTDLVDDQVFDKVLKKLSKGYSDIQTQFGNIDIQRKGITWDDENIKKYRGQLEDLNVDLKNLKGSYSNILGASNAFNTEMGEVEIAYSPMLQTDKGLVPLYQDEVNDYIQEVLNKAQDAVNNGEYSNLKDAVLAIDAKGIDEFVDTQGNKIKGLIADVGDTAEETGKQMHENWELISKSFGETIDNGEEFAKLLNYIKNLDLDDLKEIGINVDSVKLGELKANLIELAQKNFPEFAKAAKESADGIEVTKEQLKEFKATSDESIDSLVNLETGFNSVYSAMDEFNKKGYISASTLQNLIKNDLLQFFDVVNGKLSINEAAMANAATATKAKAIEDLQAKAAAEIAAVAFNTESSAASGAASTTSNMTTKANNVKNALITLTPKILENANAWVQLNKSMGGTLEGLGDDQKKQINDIMNNLGKSIRTINSIKITGVSYTRTSARGSGGGSSRSSKTSEAQKKREEDYKKRLKKYTETLEKMEDKEEAWVKKQRELGQLSNSDMLYVTQQRIKKYNQYLNKIKKATWMNTEDRKKLQKEYTDKLKDLQLDYFDYLKGKLKDQTKAIEDARDKRIKALEEEYDKRIDLLKKQKQKEDDINKRQELVNDVEYWKQRTGREAVENLAKAQKELEEYDRDARIDAQIKALEEEEKLKKESIERQAQNEINVLQKTYNAKVKAFSESNKIIYDNSVIESKKLFNTYKKNFVDPLKKELKNINKKSVTYTVKKGDTLASIAKKYNTSVKKIKAANSSVKNGKVKKGQKLKIPMYHQGGIVGGDEETLALLKKGEVVLNTSWSASLNRMMKYFDNATQRNINPINNNSKIEVSGNLVNIQANVRNQSDIDAIGQKVEKILRDKFNIKK